MFPLTYFAPHYWPAHYFPEAGETVSVTATGPIIRDRVNFYGAASGGTTPWVVVIAGSTPRFEVEFYKDGAVWDIAGSTVILSFARPEGGAKFDVHGTLLVPSAGTAYYQALTTTLDADGDWTRSWTVEVGAFVLESEPRGFFVGPSQRS